VLINTAVSQARDPVQMAGAFALAVEAGETARLAGPIEPRDLAAPSTPVIGTAFRG
jgi:thiazole synthase